MEQALIGLAGVLIGSLVSYWLLTQYQERKETERHHSLCVSALYLLISRCSNLVNFSNHYLTEDNSDIQDRFKGFVIYDYKMRDKIDFSSLAFLADKHDSNFLYDLTLAESTYFNFLNAYDTRNSDLERAISKAGDKTGLGEIFSEGELKLFIYNTESMVDFSKRSLESSEKAMNQLAAIIERRFPGLPHPKPTIDKTKNLQPSAAPDAQKAARP